MFNWGAAWEELLVLVPFGHFQSHKLRVWPLCGQSSFGGQWSHPTHALATPALLQRKHPVQAGIQQVIKQFEFWRTVVLRWLAS